MGENKNCLISLNIQRTLLVVENLEEVVTPQSLWFWPTLHIACKCWFEMHKRAIKLQIWIHFSCYTSLISCPIKPDFTCCEWIMMTVALNVILWVSGVSQFCLLAQSCSSISPSLCAYSPPSPTLAFMFPATATWVASTWLDRGVWRHPWLQPPPAAVPAAARHTRRARS